MITFVSKNNMPGTPIKEMIPTIRESGCLEFCCQPGDGTNYHFLIIWSHGRWIIVNLGNHTVLTHVGGYLLGNSCTIDLMREILNILTYGTLGKYYDRCPIL